MCVSQQCSRETHTLIVSIFFSCNVAAPSCGHFASLQVTSNKELNSLSLKILISLWFDLNHFGVRRKCCFQPMWSRLGGKMYWPDAVVSKSVVIVLLVCCISIFGLKSVTGNFAQSDLFSWRKQNGVQWRLPFTE